MRRQALAPQVQSILTSRTHAQSESLGAQDQIFLAVIAAPLLVLAVVTLYTVFKRRPEDAVRRYSQRAQIP